QHITRHKAGSELTGERAPKHTPEKAPSTTGIPAETVVSLGERYGHSKAAFIRANYGLQRHAGGGMAVRTIACLPALVGAWRDAGGGVLLSTSGAFAMDDNVLHRPDLMRGNPRTINMSRLGEALTEARPPVRAIYVYNSNPAAA